MLYGENGSITYFKYFICYPTTSCAFVSYIFIENTESLMCKDRGACFVRVRFATEKKRLTSMECTEPWGLLKLSFLADYYLFIWYSYLMQKDHEPIFYSEWTQQGLNMHTSHNH